VIVLRIGLRACLNLKKEIFFSPSLKGGKFLENSSKFHPLGFGEINFDEF
jgi:hypothetical protein